MELRQYERLVHLATADRDQFDYLLHCAIGISEHKGEGYIFDLRSGQTISQRIKEMEDWLAISRDTVSQLTELRDYAARRISHPDELGKMIDLMRLPGGTRSGHAEQIQS